jgi:hypothetical protein
MTIVISQALKWLLRRPYIVEDVDLQSSGKKLVRGNTLVQNWFSKQEKNCTFMSILRKHKIDESNKRTSNTGK